MVAARRTELYNWKFPRAANATRRDATPAEIAALLFAESHVGSRHVPRTVAATIVFTTPAFQAAVRDETERGRAIKALVVHWLETREDAAQMYQAMTAASSLGLKEGAGVAAKLLDAQGGTPLYRINAAFMVARLAAKEHAAALEKCFADTAGQTIRRSVNGEIVATEVQVRDAALAALLLLSDQNPEDYGFVEQYKGSGAARYSYTSCHLPEAARAAAFEKWKAWRAKHPDWGVEKK
jgi:hypothetical protein